MRPLPIKSVAAVAVSLCLPFTPAVSRAANLTTTNIVPANGPSWSSPAIWKTNSPGMATNASSSFQTPVIQNTYEMVQNGTNTIGNGLNNTRVRNPQASGLQTFPGASLT